MFSHLLRVTETVSGVSGVHSCARSPLDISCVHTWMYHPGKEGL